MKLKKICFVTDEYDHPDFPETGGIGTFIRNLAYELNNRGIEVHVFSYIYALKRNRKINDKGIIIHSVNRSNKITRILFLILKGLPFSLENRKLLETFIYNISFSLHLYFFAFKNKFDVFEFNDHSGNSCFFLNKNVVIRCHGNAKTLHDHMGYPKNEKSILFEKLAFKLHKNIVSVSKYSSDTTVESFGLSKKPKVIYNSVKVNSFDLDNVVKNGYVLNKSIYYFGCLRERKGLKIACNVINKSIEKNPDLTFHLIGRNENNNWENICLKILSPNALKRTFYYGSIEQSKAFEYLRNAHVVIFPSYGENFSLALLEVMALGRVVITSTISSFREVIVNGENGYLARNESEFIEQIDYIFNNEFIKDVAINAYNTVANNFNNNLITLENINYYETMLSIKKGDTATDL